MVPVSLYDRVDVEIELGGRGVTCTVSGAERVAGGQRNLATRAAKAVLASSGLDARVAISLDKNIPVGAGLGGGSSDAAAVMRVLSRLLGDRVDAGRLHELAVGLGADVPFFLACRPAMAR